MSGTPLALAEDRGEFDTGEKQPDQFFRSSLELVGCHGDTDTSPRDLRNQFRNSFVGFRINVDMLGIIFHEIRAHGRDRIRRAELFGNARSTSRMMPLPTKWQYSS